MDNFKGTAEFYRNRPQYPNEFFASIAEKMKLDSRGRLLDVGCGPGSLSIPFSRYFEQVIAVDASGEMIEEGKRNASDAGVTNISWQVMRGEEMTDDLGHFRLVSFGNSLHWFDRSKMFAFVKRALEPQGGVVIVGVSSIWSSAPEPWQQIVLSLVKKYLGEERRTIGGAFPKRSGSYTDMLRETGFTEVETSSFFFPERTMTAEGVIREQHSTSYAAPELFGDQLEAFDIELKSILLNLNSDNEFTEWRQGSLVTAKSSATRVEV